MLDNQLWGILPPFKRAPLPPLPSILTALGPGVIFMALAQGSGELIWLNRYRNNHGTNNYAKKDEPAYPSRQDLPRGIEDGKLEPKIEH